MTFEDHASSTDWTFETEQSVPRLRARTAGIAKAAAAVYRGVPRQTLKNSISCTGIGLHTGFRVSMTLHPAAPGTGVVFRRTLPGGDVALIPALWTHVLDSRQCTVVGLRDSAVGASVATVEHLMAAVAAMGIDDLLIDIDGPEVPAMDGSAAPFVFLIECAGVVAQCGPAAAPRTAIRILEPVTVSHNGAEATLAPTAGSGLSVSFEIEFAAAAIGRQATAVKVSPSVFKDQVSRARTFGLVDDLPKMRAAGLARGGSLENAVVVNGADVLNEGGLRYPDEFVRHKILDAVGDLALAGRPIIGAYTGKRASHALNTGLLQALFAKPSAWIEVDALTGEPMDAEPLKATA
ncbi:UDP-3-O-acyl-N-acetylglucosamine deacetylase [Novispirillum sp. DQ9]|uniref:UDP-3-O-acyl-N-acetylglucosamine deacetylase n=1 Tax=Novispirillum sp. DQ9 TaxID=3398612 RepID=UPI003C7D2102